MKVVLLAGGFGTRLSEETHSRPKPMVEIGGKPILCHIMELYSHFGFSEFVVACGYHGEFIKKYFHDLHSTNDCVFDFRAGTSTTLNDATPDWKVSLVNTGLNTKTGGRIKRLREFVAGERFMATYGDGLSNIDIDRLVQFHDSHGRLATLTAVRPPARFGCLQMDGAVVTDFSEKSQIDAGWVNGGFFVFEPEVFDYIPGDETKLEVEPLERLARDQQLMAYQHNGFWMPMDTLREKNVLQELWEQGRAPWASANLGVGDSQLRSAA